MTTYDPAAQAAAVTEIQQLTADYEAAERALETAREALREGIARHLMQRSAPPGVIADASPYDRNHVRRIGIAAGVPPIREPKPKPRKRTAGAKPSG